jgi:hypothetical protein
MAKTVVGIFNDFTEAINTLTDFVHAGIPKEHISIVTPDSEREFAKYLSTPGERSVAEDTGIGAVIGGLSGLLIGLVLRFRNVCRVRQPGVHADQRLGVCGL